MAPYAVEGLTVSGNKHQILEVLQGRRSILRIFLWPPEIEGGDYLVAAGVCLGNGKFSPPVTTTLQTDKWQRIRAKWKAASAPGANDGYLRLLRGKKLVGSIESLANDAHRINRAHFGQVTKGRKHTNGQVYYDNFRSKWKE